MKLGNLIIAGIVTGSIYAAFAALVALWYRVSNILNLAVGDFAMMGALGVDDLVHNRHWAIVPAILAILAAVAVGAYAYDRVVLRLAQDGRTRQEGIVVTFFFTFALSFFLEGLAEILYGTNVHAAPDLWSGPSLSIFSSGLHVERAGVLVVGFAAVVGVVLAVFLRRTLRGKAIEACGENYLGARIVGIDNRQYRRMLFVLTAILAAVFGTLESPITGYTFNSGASISLTGFIAAAFAGFQKPGKAVLAGLGIGVLEALLGGYVSTQNGDTVLYALLAAVILIRPGALGLDVAFD
jgi:branched-subunit amino acid ABC-type transport system permease component